MSKRVYDVARELGLSTNEVMRRLNDAGVGVKSHLAVVEDHVYQRIFGDASGGHSSGGAKPNGSSKAQKADALPSGIQRQRKRVSMRRVLAYILAAALVLAVAAGIGAMAALILQGDLSLFRTKEPQQVDEQQDAPRAQENEPAAQQPEKPASEQNEAGEQENAPSSQEQEEAAGQSETEYVARVGDIQADSVETFLDSHDKLLRYDALTADDVEEMRANKDALKQLNEEVGSLDPPQRYRQQFETLDSAIDELYEAARLAYNLAADPTAATQSGFEEYDRHVNEATAGLKRSNEILGRDYKTIEDVQEVSPLS